MNKVILIGRLANDPESRTLSSGIAHCAFRLAVQRRFANAQGVREADFLNVVCWRKTAELCAAYLKKGQRIAIEGSIQTRTYDAQDGSKRYATEIIADNVEFIESREENAQQCAPAPQQPANQEGFTEVDDDDLPF